MPRVTWVACLVLCACANAEGGRAGSPGAAGAAPSGGAGSGGGAAGSSTAGAAGAATAGTSGAAGVSGASGSGPTTGNGGTGAAGTGSGGNAGGGSRGASTGNGGCRPRRLDGDRRRGWKCKRWGRGRTEPGDPSGWVPALLGVGYGGLRIVSRDGGKTWGDRAYETTNGGDDDVLLRAVAYGKGIWVATGWKLWTSADGVHWTDHGKLGAGPLTACSIVEGLAYKDGWFFAACTPWDAPGTIFRSSDGLVWTKHATIGDTGGHLFLTYRGSKLVAYGDTKTSFQSDDGLTWTVMPGLEQATYCGDSWKSQTDCQSSSWFDGVYLRADWQGKISRSTDGSMFTVVYQDDQKNTLYQSRAIAAGLVPPK